MAFLHRVTFNRRAAVLLSDNCVGFVYLFNFGLGAVSFKRMFHLKVQFYPRRRVINVYWIWILKNHFHSPISNRLNVLNLDID